ncbi:Transcription initiation factor TFIID subunit 9 [Crenichthys baileyi]|uniref:Transcription initiation factor TFIID subunit 9 n=1 Tax=Crenichthys baileyi TaxID=28760 RepID=A0AAV9S977_9TELE
MSNSSRATAVRRIGTNPWQQFTVVSVLLSVQCEAVEAVDVKMSAPKTIPKDAQVMIQILKDMGVTEYEPRVINQMLEFTYRYVTTIIEDAKIYATHAKKSNVDADDIKLAIQCRMDQSFTSPPPRDFLLEVARQKNQTPLPLIKPYTGPRLPPDRYCLTAPNYRLKSIQKKVSSSASRISVPRLSVGAVSSRPTTPTLGTPSVQSVTTKVGTPVSLTGQRFTVQIPPPSQTTTTKTTTASTPAVSNVLINPSLIGSKNILITTNMVSQNAGGDSLKRKHDDDDDYDAL